MLQKSNLLLKKHPVYSLFIVPFFWIRRFHFVKIYKFVVKSPQRTFLNQSSSGYYIVQPSNFVSESGINETAISFGVNVEHIIQGIQCENGAFTHN